MKALVSIVIPVYNGEDYIKKAIDSALNQTYNNIEVIVINDGSTDKTDSICLSYGNKIRYYKKENGGVSSALNLAISKMKGKYFSWLSHDDIYLSNKIEVDLKNIKDDKTIIYGDYLLINSKGVSFDEPVVLDEDELVKKPFYVFLRGALNGITMLVPKKAFEENGNFDNELKCVQDYDMWLRLYKNGYHFVHIKNLLTQTRLHKKQDTNNNPNVLIEGNKLWINMIDYLSDEEKIEYEGSLYNFYYKQGEYLLLTPYKDALEYCINKCIQIDSEKYKNKPIKKNKNGIKYYMKYLKEHGFGYTIKKVIKKIFK